MQKHYVDLRLKELETTNTHAVARALFVIEKLLLERMPADKRPRYIPVPELHRVYRAIEDNLQSAELTCNFKADTWFTAPNPYDTYTQMYQRAVQGGRMVLMDTAQNQADTRANVDNNVTFPKSWQAAAPARRGLRPGLQRGSSIQKQMDTGALTDVRAKSTDLAAWVAGNKHFNPDTKQVFLALNYGRRPHGSSTNYGWSYFVAKSELRPRCIYYSRDTFHTGTSLTMQGPVVDATIDAGNLQVPYATLGSIIGHEGRHIRGDIFKSCYEGQMLEDIVVATTHADYLLEAHHFGELTFREHVDHMVISPRETSDRALWPKIVANAKVFCRRNGIRLFQTGD